LRTTVLQAQEFSPKLPSASWRLGLINPRRHKCLPGFRVATI